jgi:uncharacterized membrane protein YdjX (TVP38/TMEM64 family)
LPGLNYLFKQLATFFVAVALCGAILWETAHLHDNGWRKDDFVHSLRAGGVTGPLTCIGAEFAQVVVFVVPGTIIEFAAGYVFGPWISLLYLLVGVLLGSAFNFYFARVVGRPVLQRLINRTTLDKVDRLLARSPGKMALFLLFLLPETPKDAICYGAGLTGMRPLEFVLISSLARSPVILATTMLASQANHHRYWGLIITSSVVLVALGGIHVYHRWREASGKTHNHSDFTTAETKDLAA